MYTRTDYIMTQIGEELAKDRLREGDNERLVRLAMSPRQGWFSRQICRLLMSLGNRLVTLGEALQQKSMLTSYFSTR